MLSLRLSLSVCKVSDLLKLRVDGAINVSVFFRKVEQLVSNKSPIISILILITHNGFGLAEGGEFEILMFKFTIMLNRNDNVQFSTSAPLLASPC